MTADLPQDRAAALESLARAQFGALTDAESKVLTAAPQGKLALCAPMRPRFIQPNTADESIPARRIRATLLRWLCLEPKAQTLIDPRGIWIYGARIVDNLDLSSSIVPFPLFFLGCLIERNLALMDAQIPMLSLEGTSVAEIAADRFRTQGSVFLRNGFRADGWIHFAEAHIGGDFDCSQATISNPDRPHVPHAGIALQAQGLVIAGIIRLDGSSFGGAVSFSGAQVRGDVFLNNSSFTGQVEFSGAEITGTVSCEGATLNGSPDRRTTRAGYALMADGLTVGGAVLLRNGSHFLGGVHLVGAKIQVDCTASTFENPPRAGVENTGIALALSQAFVNGLVDLKGGFRAFGTVFLLQSHIGDLNCSGAVLENPAVTGLPQSGLALAVDGINAGSIFLRDGFRSGGTLRLTGALIDGDLDCSNAEFEGTFLLERTKITRGLILLLAHQTNHAVYLTDTTTDALYDNKKAWPPNGLLRVDGFVYREIAEGPTDAASRLDWLERSATFSPQPYRQLAKVLQDSGDDQAAKAVLMEMERRERAGQWTSPVFRYTIGYGYHPLWAIFEIAGLAGLGWIIYRRAYLAGNMVPTDKDTFNEFMASGASPPHYVTFSAGIYSLEQSLPLVKLGQADKWRPIQRKAGALFQRPTASLRSLRQLLRRMLSSPPFSWWMARTLIASARQWLLSPGSFLRVFLWLQILLGWILAALFAAGVAGLIRSH